MWNCLRGQWSRSVGFLLPSPPHPRKVPTLFLAHRNGRPPRYRSRVPLLELELPSEDHNPCNYSIHMYPPRPRITRLLVRLLQETAASEDRKGVDGQGLGWR